MKVSRKAYGSNSSFQNYIKILYHQRDFCIFNLCTLTTSSCSWMSLYTSYFLFPRLTPSGFFNGMLGFSKPGALNFYTFFHLIQLTLFVSRNLTLINFTFPRFLDSLLCNLTTPTPGLVFCFLMPHMLAAALSFSSDRTNPFRNFLPPLFLCLTPTLIM